MMNLKDKIDSLCKLSRPVVNDERQDKYCEYITRFCSHYKHGDTQEGCKVVGSTREGIRLRLEKDEGDFDYLVYSWIPIPTEALEFRQDLPCFCHIKGESVIDKFGGEVELIDGIYLPSSVLRDVNKKAFPLLKGILEIVSSFESTHGRHTLHLSLKQDIKPGISKVIYNGWECEELQDIPLQRKGDPKKIMKLIQNAMSQSPELRQSLGPIVAFCGIMGSLKQRGGENSEASIYQNLGPLMEAFGGNLYSAKPAIKDENARKDFCLGCNEAEMLLADAMLPIQRKSMLLIKAFVKSVLKKFADLITTFHWKTALYRVSESKDALQTSLDDSPDNIIKFTKEVIEYMTQSVCERKLQHFFCDSNLFAGLSDDTVAWFTYKLIYLHDNIESSLERFLIESEKKEMKVEEVDESKIQMATKTLLDDSNEDEVEGIISVMSGIAEMTDDDDDMKLTEAIIDVFLHASSYLIEEMDRGKHSSSSNRENPGASSSAESRRNAEMGDAVVSLLSASSGREKKKAQDKLVQNLLAGIFKK
ncbi:hypothetical protein FSP39_014854 [Pinctada imbricata]|uniref:Uncharacterized protein n=1 Tax=Pinctada imbricata TaxID=66713 RepID=A0AA88YCT8_PINIB|nr:hypothetical protein FSP39_014854 [Pinctada imbricata]